MAAAFVLMANSPSPGGTDGFGWVIRRTWQTSGVTVVWPAPKYPNWCCFLQLSAPTRVSVRWLPTDESGGCWASLEVALKKYNKKLVMLTGSKDHVKFY